MQEATKFVRACAVFAGVLLVLAGGARSQPPPYSYAYLSVLCPSDTLRVVLTAFDRGEHPEIVGFHVYRRTLGVCDSRVRVTADPLARAAGTDYTRSVDDPSAPADLAHVYQISAVDGNGSEVDPYMLFSVTDSYLWVVASCAAAPPIAAGFVEDWGWLAVAPCPESCYDWALLEEFPPELRAFAGTQTPVVVYGWFVCGTVEGCLGHVTHFATTSCLVSTQDRTWSGFKQLFR